MKGGGIKGLAYLGALEILEDHYTFDWYAGTSAGAISAILLGCGHSTKELKEILIDKDFNDFKDASFLKRIWNLFSKSGLYEANTFTVWLDELLAKKLDYPVHVKLKDLPFKTTVYASGKGQKTIVFDSDDPNSSENRAAYAARCSMAIPIIFTPQKKEGLNVFDGGVQNNYPVKLVLESKPETNFIGLYLGPETFEGYQKRNSIIKELIEIWTESVDLEALRNYREQTVIIDPRPISTTDFKLTKEEKEFLIESGRVAALKFLSNNSQIELPSDFSNREKELNDLRDSISKRKSKKRRRNNTLVTTLLILISASIWAYKTDLYYKMFAEPVEVSSDPFNYDMVIIDGGKFQMGSNDKADEMPIHEVNVKTFQLAKFEVTQAQWEAVMGNNPSAFQNCQNCPVENVSWLQAQEFIGRLNERTSMNYRLPTEEEWEFAARGGNKSEGFLYSGGNSLDIVAWYSNNSSSKTQPVGSRKPNELGIYDLNGNVWEWSSTLYYSSYDPRAIGNQENESEFSREYALRGGSWNNASTDCRIAERNYWKASERDNDLGLRLAHDFSSE